MLPDKGVIIKYSVIKLDLCYDKKMISYELSDNFNKLNDSSTFTHDESYYKAFQTSKARLDDIFVNSLKRKFGFINTNLKGISLKIAIDRSREMKGDLVSYYKIKPLSKGSPTDDNDD